MTNQIKIEPSLRLPPPSRPPAQQTFVTPRRKFESPERRENEENWNRITWAHYL